MLRLELRERIFVAARRPQQRRRFVAVPAAAFCLRFPLRPPVAPFVAFRNL